jgi:hypothetical protein
MYPLLPAQSAYRAKRVKAALGLWPMVGAVGCAATAAVLAVFVAAQRVALPSAPRLAAEEGLREAWAARIAAALRASHELGGASDDGVVGGATADAAPALAAVNADKGVGPPQVAAPAAAAASQTPPTAQDTLGASAGVAEVPEVGGGGRDDLTQPLLRKGQEQE